MSKLILENQALERLEEDLPAGNITFPSYQTSLTLFKQSYKGPDAIGDCHLPFATENPDHDLDRLGSFYSVAIGQGSHYNSGFFGPLPALGSDYLCLIYAAIVRDSNTFDQRMNGWNYVFACFFYHGSLNSLINQERDEIEGIFRSFFRNNRDLGTISCKSIHYLKQQIIEVLHE